MPKHDYRKLLRRTLMAIALCIAAVLVCYFWVDRPVAFFIDHHQINKFKVFRWLTYPPPELQTWSPLVLTVLMVRRRVGTICAVAKSAVGRVPQLDRGRSIPYVAGGGLWSLLAGNLVQ
jgi:hypothetical protein